MFAGGVDDVPGVPGYPAILYAAHSTGGLVKSVKAGNPFQSEFDTRNQDQSGDSYQAILRGPRAI